MTVVVVGYRALVAGESVAPCQGWTCQGLALTHCGTIFTTHPDE